jgi:hypothetical protein
MATKTDFSIAKSVPPSGVFSKGKKSVPIPHIETRSFKYGLITYPQADNIPRGASASGTINFITKGDHMETRNGYAPLGTEQNIVGAVNGIKTAHKWDGTEVLFKAVYNSLFYYNTATSAWVEVGGSGAKVLAGANGEDISFAEYSSPAGAQLWVSSPNSGLFKIMTANPGTIKNMYESARNFKGRIKIMVNRMFLWHYLKSTLGNGSNSSVALSFIDSENYTTTSNEALGTGDGNTKSFTGTSLVQVSVATFKTAFAVQIFAPIAAGVSITGITQSPTPTVTAAGHGLVKGDKVLITGVAGMTQVNGKVGNVVSITDSANFIIDIDTSTYTAYSSGGTSQRAELFIDDYLGNLVSNLGGTGTINYSTGAWAVVFSVAPINSGSVQGTYSWEDSTQKGVADFTESATRNAGEGAIFLQGDGGDLYNVCVFNAMQYCLHQRKTWQLSINSDDTTSQNLIYRDHMTPASWQSCIETSYGIFYVDVTDNSHPYFAVLELVDTAASTQVLPKDLSSLTLDLSGYLFDKSFAVQWNNYIVFTARTVNSVANNTMFLYNRELGIWDVTDFFGNNLAVYGGTLVAGDSVTVNVYTLFSGFDDDKANPNYQWFSNVDNYGIVDLKKCKRLYIEGYIDINQIVNVLASVDSGQPVIIGTISGKGSYLDKGQAVLIGSLIVGKSQIGGGSNGATAFHYLTEIKMNVLGKFQKRQISFQPTGIGYFSFQMYSDYDIRLGQSKLPSKYRS